MAVSAFLHGPGAPVDVTVVTGSDRLLVAQVVAGLRQALGDQGLRTTVLVDQMLHADLPVDIESTTAPPPDPAEPQERCASCAMRRRLLPLLARVAWGGGADHVVLVTSAQTVPRSVVAAFGEDRHARLGLGTLGQLHQLVTVASARQVAADLATTARLADRGVGPDGPRWLPVAERAAEQLEIADVIVVADAHDDHARRRMHLTATGLNPGAALVTLDDRVGAMILQGPRFDADVTARPAWDQILRHGGDDGRWHRWTRDRPLDGDRLGSLLQGGGWRQLLRAKGWLWLASDPAVAFGWSQAGPTVSLTPQQPWDPLPRHLGARSYAPWTPPSTELVMEPDPVRRPLPGQRLALYADAATHRHLVGGLDACLVD